MRPTMLVATHKAAPMPNDGLYLPVHVGHALDPKNFGFQPDDEGDNISSLNRSHCELTALYWAWKNLDSDAIGLSHYRRYFVGNAPGPSGSKILSGAQALALLSKYDVVLGRPRNYVIETIDSHYRNAHHGADLDVLERALGHLSPEFLPAYNQVFRGRTLSLYNMFLMRQDVFQSYAAWLFPILEATAKEIGIAHERTSYQQRTIGYLGERLLNVWVAGRPDLKVTRRKIVNTDGERKLRKAIKLLKRKAGVLDPHSRTD